MAHTYLELQQNEQAVRIYDGLSQAGLAESTYIMAQVGHVTIRVTTRDYGHHSMGLNCESW